MRFDVSNPILDRELRQRSRSWRMPSILTAYLLVIYLIFITVYLAFRDSLQWQTGSDLLQASAEFGRMSFEATALVILGLMCLIIPAMSGAAINTERDRQTLIPLQVSLLGTGGIFWGKLTAASSFVVLLVIGAMPIMAVSYAQGGILLSHIALTVVALLVQGICFATVGASISSIMRRPVTSIMLTYFFVALLSLGVFVPFVLLGITTQTSHEWTLYLNPVVTLASVAGRTAEAGGGDGPLSSIYQQMTNQWEWDENFGEGFGFPPLWFRCFAPLLLISGMFCAAGYRRLRTPSEHID